METISTTHHKIPMYIVNLIHSPESILDMSNDELRTLRDDFNKLYLETSYYEFKDYADKISKMLSKVECILPSTEDEILGGKEDPVF